MTPNQLATIHKAKAALQLNDPQYRTILRNAAQVESAKHLTNQGFENVMAVMEDQGFQAEDNPTRWRDVVAARANGEISSRALRHLHALAQQAAYQLGGMVRRMTGGRTDDPAKLTPQEAYATTEALMGIVARAERAAQQGQLFPSEAAAKPGNPVGRSPRRGQHSAPSTQHSALASAPERIHAQPQGRAAHDQDHAAEPFH